MVKGVVPPSECDKLGGSVEIPTEIPKVTVMPYEITRPEGVCMVRNSTCGKMALKLSPEDNPRAVELYGIDRLI